jgi:hypothetical protein
VTRWPDCALLGGDRRNADHHHPVGNRVDFPRALALSQAIVHSPAAADRSTSRYRLSLH